MNKLPLLIVTILFAALPLKAERVAPETAQKAAKTFLNNNGAKSAQLTDRSKEAGFPNLYIFTAERGFVVMAADDRVQPILGYSLDGYLIDTDMPGNVRGWLQGYSDEIQFAIDSKAKATAETAKQWKDLIDGNSKAAKATPVVAPLIKTKWNQNKYYNNLCPAVSDGPDGHAYTGCVATAMAQIMKYWEYPTKGKGYSSLIWNGQILSADFSNTTYDWENMGLYYEYYYPDPTGGAVLLDNSYHTPEKVAAVATLMYHCGMSVKMTYGGFSNGGSGALISNVASALKNNFNYNPSIQYISKFNYTNNGWKSILKTELDAGRPLQYNGNSGPNTSSHSFVCDGYDNLDNFHFNWGWAGSLDGYFTLSNLNTGANTQSGAGNGDFTEGQTAFIYIQPKFNNNPPSNLQATVEQGTGYRNISLSWSAATDASQYRIYRNNQNLATVSANDLTYTDVNLPYGTYNYQVRSVDADGLLSQPTNTATVNLEPVVKDLNATPNGNDIALSWTALAANPQSTTLQYVECVAPASIGALSSTTQYWAVRYPASTLANYENLALTSVGNWCTYGSNISINVYQCTGSAPTGNAIWTHSFSDNPGNTIGAWREFTFNPILLDPSKDLWIVYASTNAVSGKGPIYMRPVTSSEGNYISYDGVNWNHWNGYTFPIAAGITYGTYTYNLYRNGEKVAQNMSTTNFTDPNRNNAASYYTVTTNYFGGESAASNGVGHTIGQGSLNSLELGANDRMTVRENSTLTVTGTLSNDNPENLIIENSAQLIHNSADVKATVKKTIAPYTANDNGWNFIASPVTEDLIPSTDNGLIANGYDLYYYDEPEHYWRNYNSHSNDFIIEHKKGYLYANNTETTLQFEGTLAPSNQPFAINDLSHLASRLNGFNLVGNPFACNATINQDCYVITNNQVVLAPGNKVFAPCEGAFVKATSENGYSVTFTKNNGAKANGKGKSLDLVVTKGNSKGGVSVGSTAAILDRARVRLGEGTNMEKFNLNDISGTSLIFCQDGQDYSMAYTNGQNELPLNFKATEDGTYTLEIEANSLGVDYLHLIDNFAGADVDLLQTPAYTFTAKTTDYASRFRLVFNANDASTSSASDAPFAYISDGNIVITADTGSATLQVIDMMGRVIVSHNGRTRCVSTAGMTAGVYVLRLIDGENVRMQKILIE